MAYKNPGKEAQQRSSQLVHAVNDALRQYYDKAKTAQDKRIFVSISVGPGSKARTPEEQASFLLSGKSWTANSSHMADGAKHILVKEGGIATWDLKQLQLDDKGAFDTMVKAWNGAMKTQDLRNYKGGKAFDHTGSDPLHMELPNSRLPDNDPRVVKTLEIYAKATRLEGKAKNLSFESVKGSQFQKDWLRDYDKKLANKQKGTKGGP
jgi:hypothetical protein